MHNRKYGNIVRLLLLPVTMTQQLGVFRNAEQPVFRIRKRESARPIHRRNGHRMAVSKPAVGLKWNGCETHCSQFSAKDRYGAQANTRRVIKEATFLIDRCALGVR